MEIIHIVLGKANPERLNGVNKVVHELISHQVESKQQVFLWGISNDLSVNFPARNFKTLLFQKHNNPFLLNHDLKNAIRTSSADTIFHLHGGWIPLFFSLSKFLMKHGKRYVITPHGAYNEIAMKKNFFVKRLYYLLFEKYVLKNAKKIHLIGKSEVSGLSKIYHSTTYSLVPYGFEPSTATNSTRVQTNEIVFGFIGRIDIYTKGLDVLVNAFEKFQEKVSNTKLWVVGDGVEKSKLEAIVTNKKLQHKVIFVGKKFGKEKEQLLQQMDVFMHPSRNEGLPASVLEAASFGKPCIVSSFTNVGDQIEQYEAGITVKEFTATNFTKAMLDLYENWKNYATYSKMCSNAIQMVKIEFDWTKVLNELNQTVYS